MVLSACRGRAVHKMRDYGKLGGDVQLWADNMIHTWSFCGREFKQLGLSVPSAACIRVSRGHLLRSFHGYVFMIRDSLVAARSSCFESDTGTSS